MTDQTIAATSSSILANTDTLALLVFTADGQKYSLPITSVVRIVEMVTITPLPNVPLAIQGIINLQGKVVVMIDLRCRFGLPKQPYGLHTPIILVEINKNGQIMGLIVDTVEDVVHISSKELEIIETFLPPQLIEEMTLPVAYLAGVFKVDRQMIPVLNVQALLTTPEQTELSQVLSNDIMTFAVE